MASQPTTPSGSMMSTTTSRSFRNTGATSGRNCSHQSISPFCSAAAVVRVGHNRGKLSGSQLQPTWAAKSPMFGTLLAGRSATDYGGLMDFGVIQPAP